MANISFVGPTRPVPRFRYGTVQGARRSYISLCLLQHCRIAARNYAIVRVRSRYVGHLAALGLFGMLWMLGDQTFIWNLLYPLLPHKVKIGIHPEYTYCIFVLALAGLAGMGLDGLRIPDSFRWAVGSLIADLFLVGSGRPMNVVGETRGNAPFLSGASDASVIITAMASRVQACSPARTAIPKPLRPVLRMSRILSSWPK